MQREHLHPFAPLNRMKTIAIIAVAAALGFLFGDRIADALRLFFGACLISFLLAPLCSLLEKQIKRPIAVLISLAGSILLVLAAIAFLLPTLARQLAGLGEMLPDAFQRLGGLLEGLAEQAKRLLPGVELPKPDLSGLQRDFSGMAKNTIGYASSLASSIYQLTLMIVLSYFLLSDRKRILLRAELLVPSPWRRIAVRTGNTLLRELRLYLRGQATIALAVGILAALCFMLIGVPSGALLGMIVGAFNVIPYFGPILGGIPAVLLALGISWQRAAFAIGAVFLVQQIDGLVISPRVMGNITGFSPALVLIALFLGSRAGGISGMLLAMPTLMTIRTLYRVFVQRYEND